jgi:hypothetical protein
MGHRNGGRKPRPLAERYWPKVDKRGPDECWPWLGAKNPHGYGQMYPGPDREKRRSDTIFAHHLALEFAGIEVPPGLVRDHICKNRACQNPAHIRLVTQRVNCTENSDSPHAKNSRVTHCPRGHPYSPENTAIIPLHPAKGRTKSGRVCLTCEPARWRYAIVPRDPPPNAKTYLGGWRGPFRTDQEAA